AVVLADEPSGELDAANAELVYDALAAAAAAVGAALVLVSHDRRAARIADRVVRIRDGRLSETWQPGGEELLVVDDRGWLRLPEQVRPPTAAVRVVGAADGGGLVPAGPPAAAEEPPPKVPAAPA